MVSVTRTLSQARGRHTVGAMIVGGTTKAWDVGVLTVGIEETLMQARAIRVGTQTGAAQKKAQHR